MEDLIAHLYNKFDPLRPATDREYVDTASVRGNEALARYFLRRLVITNNYLSIPFTGHIGGGKSTELQHLRHCLRNPDPETGRKRYLPILLNVLDYFDEFTASTVEILLAIVSEIGDLYRTDPELKIELRDNLLTRRLGELKQALLSDVQIPQADLTIGHLKSTLKLLRRDLNRREQVRSALEREPGQFLDAVNLMILEARATAKQKGFEDIVILIDSLDRIEKTPSEGDKTVAHRSLFLDSAYVFADLRAHKVLTVPLSFVRAHGPQLSLRYGAPPFVLPLVKVENRKHGQYPPGHLVLRELVIRRIAPNALDAAFDDDALEYLIRYSGGHPRMFIRFLMESLAESDELPVRLAAARIAVRPTIQTMTPAVHSDWWPKLAALELSPTQQVDEEDPDTQRMLEETMILEYLNGDEAAGGFEDDAPWYSVHPILRELQSFKLAVEDLKRSKQKHENESRSAP